MKHRILYVFSLFVLFVPALSVVSVRNASAQAPTAQQLTLTLEQHIAALSKAVAVTEAKQQEISRIRQQYQELLDRNCSSDLGKCLELFDNLNDNQLVLSSLIENIQKEQEAIYGLLKPDVGPSTIRTISALVQRIQNIRNREPEEFAAMCLPIPRTVNGTHGYFGCMAI